MKLRDEMETWESSTILMLVGMIVVAVAAVVLDVGVHAWAWARGVPGVSWNPFELAAGLAAGEIDTASGVWTWVVGTGVVLAVLAVVVAVAAGRRRGRRKRGDDMADLAGTGRDIEALSPRAAREKAQRLRVRSDAFGLPIGRAVKSGTDLVSDFEAVCTLIAGPRTGKTTSWAVPRIYAAPGVVMATSNKRDILDITRARRRAAGRVWVFDPQQIASEPQAWWWDPLTFATDAERAARLTEAFFGAATGNATGKKDVWEEWSCQLIAGMILAAAREHLPLMTLHRWINDQTDREAVKILRRHGEEASAISLEGRMNLVPETRSGVYGGASRIMNFLTSSRIMTWCTPTAGLPELRPEEFVRSAGDTLYCLSQEGSGSAGGIVTAMTVAVTDAAEAYANELGGRMPTPMLIELDEAANVCRWSELPDKYSHFGSKGILLDSLFQSWSQGTRVFGEPGFKQMWGISNVRAYAGGVSERDFLAMLSDMIGTHYIDSKQVSSSASGRSVSTSWESQQRPIASVSDLQGLPSGRAWVFASQSVGVLAELVPYWKRADEKAA